MVSRPFGHSNDEMHLAKVTSAIWRPEGVHDPPVHPFILNDLQQIYALFIALAPPLNSKTAVQIAPNTIKIRVHGGCPCTSLGTFHTITRASDYWAAAAAAIGILLGRWISKTSAKAQRCFVAVATSNFTQICHDDPLILKMKMLHCGCKAIAETCI